MKFSRWQLSAAGALSALSLTLFASCAADTGNHYGTARGARRGEIPTRDGRNSTYVDGNPTNGANGPEYSVPTGSQIPRQTNRRGYTSDNQDPAFIYDQDDIRLQSKNNVGDSLRNVPGVSVGGSR